MHAPTEPTPAGTKPTPISEAADAPDTPGTLTEAMVEDAPLLYFRVMTIGQVEKTGKCRIAKKISRSRFRLFCS